VNKDAEAPRTAQVAIPQDTNPQKKELRREMRRLVKTLPQDSPTVLQILRDWITRHPQVKIISTYAPLPGEVDLTPLVTEFANLRWVFPRVEQSELVLHEVSDPSLDLEPGAFDIREPKPDLTVVNLFHVDAFLCPGLAFDDYGGRLGRGRGFYDRLLEHARRDAFKLGICHTEQLVPHTYGESHDVAMDLVISA
jgi:5-formyltetrahydrofolate cyclo-ligase